ncbi:HNH endonuclease signature motif containing protein [Marinobacterium stanieri]|uniref:HNH endonuclease n=1 Tax=Marinobacterium stanieri TaxID=49186 RepID=A0A1N6QDP8_9GAMM|nr:HNH endonuclease signature motif containing protein [Marinobacterium stanieri]SIQ14665.1 HNH endonuclease [Marinobacterium stanieri]
MVRKQYTQEQLDFLQAGFRKWGYDQLTAEFNQQFGTDKTISQIRSTVKNKGYKCGRGTGDLKRGRSELFTQQQIDWLRENYPRMDRTEITDTFNSTFGTSLSKSQIVAFLKRNKIKSGRTGHWGTKPGWNAGTAGKGICKPNKGSFKPGLVPPNITPMYTERTNKSGYIEIKVPIANPYNKQKTRYMPKHRWLWMQKHGDIPRTHAVIFKDGDRTNFDDDNLALVTRRQLSMLNIRNYFEAPAELKESIWHLVMLESAVIGSELADSDKSHQQLVQEAIKQPRTTREISDITGVHQTQVATLLCLLQKRERAKVIGSRQGVSGRHLKIWIASNSHLVGAKGHEELH